MMGDNIEHVITYWVLWQTFHSPALTGFEIISHWLPSLLFSVTFGGLAQRYDCRRLIQIAQLLFMSVSLTWGILFATHSLSIWAACILLVLHGCAGSLRGPTEQFLLHDFAEPADLPGAIRMNATFRSLGILAGPAVGSILLLGLGPVTGIFANVAFYLPMTWLMVRIPFTGHTRDTASSHGAAHPIPAISMPGAALLGAVRTFRYVPLPRAIIAMTALSGVTALFVGGSLQVSMPSFADSLGAGSAGLAYGALLLASGIGGVVGGFVLEAVGAVKPTAGIAVAGTLFYGGCILLFATTHHYLVSIAALVFAGVGSIASQSVSQSIVQLNAPAADRGRIIGLYNTVANGLRTGSGLTVAALGAAVGIQGSLALSAVIMTVATLIIATQLWRSRHHRASDLSTQQQK
jgi:MFS family permease